MKKLFHSMFADALLNNGDLDEVTHDLCRYYEAQKNHVETQSIVSRFLRNCLDCPPESKEYRAAKAFLSVYEEK